MKTLKLFNGRGHGKYDRDHMYVAAYSVAECTRLLTSACGTPISASEINVYWNKGCWGNQMDGIEATEPCVYVSPRIRNERPIRVL